MDTPLTSSRSGGMTPFIVQINFDIPLFEGKIDAIFLETWLPFLSYVPSPCQKLVGFSLCTKYRG